MSCKSSLFLLILEISACFFLPPRYFFSIRPVFRENIRIFATHFSAMILRKISILNYKNIEQADLEAEYQAWVEEKNS